MNPTNTEMAGSESQNEASRSDNCKIGFIQLYHITLLYCKVVVKRTAERWLHTGTYMVITSTIDIGSSGKAM